MKNKKAAIIILIATILLQLAVPSFAAFAKYRLENTDDIYRVKVYDVYSFSSDSLRIDIFPELEGFDNNAEFAYAILSTDESNNAAVTGYTNDKPKDSVYLRTDGGSYFFKNAFMYSTTEKYIDNLSTLFAFLDFSKYSVTADIRIRNGMAQLTGLYINELDAEDFYDVFGKDIIRDGSPFSYLTD